MPEGNGSAGARGVNVELTPLDNAKLERKRDELGHASKQETLRYLLSYHDWNVDRDQREDAWISRGKLPLGGAHR